LKGRKDRATREKDSAEDGDDTRDRVVMKPIRRCRGLGQWCKNVF